MTTALAIHEAAPTTSESRQAFVAAQRALATESGSPIVRTGSAGLVGVGAIGNFVSVEDGKPLFRSVREQEDGSVLVAPARQLTYSGVVAMVERAYGEGDSDDALNVNAGSGTAILFADKAALGYITGMVRNSADSAERYRLLNMLEYRTHLPRSLITPILVDSLNLAYWPQTVADTTSVPGWAKSFGLSDMSVEQQIVALIRVGREGAQGVLDYTKRYGSEERTGTTRSQWGNMSSQARAFKAAQALSTIHEALLDADPVLAPLNVILGRVAEIQPFGRGGTRIKATISGNFKGKTGKDVYIFDADPTMTGGDAKLERFEYNRATDEFVATIGSPTPRGKADRHSAWLLLDQAAESRRTLFVAPKPFLSSSRGGVGDRWLSAPSSNYEASLGGQEVPVDVLLAGATAW